MSESESSYESWSSTDDDHDTKTATTYEIPEEDVGDVNEFSHSDNNDDLLTFDPFANDSCRQQDLQLASATEPTRYFLSNDIYFASPTETLAAPFRAILEGRAVDAKRNRDESRKYYKEKVLQVDPFDLVHLESVIDGTPFVAFPHQFACLVGNVSYLDALVECLKTSEEFRSIVNFGPLRLDKQRLSPWTAGLAMAESRQDESGSSTTIERIRSSESRSPFVPRDLADPSSFPNGGLDLLLLTHPVQMRSIEEFACRIPWDHGGSVILEFLHKHGICDPFYDQNVVSLPPLYVAAQMGDVKVFDFLQKNHFESSAPTTTTTPSGEILNSKPRRSCLNWKRELTGENLFHCVAACGRHELLKYLIDNRCESAIDGIMDDESDGKHTPFSACCTYAEFAEAEKGDAIKCLELLMENGGHLYCIKERELCNNKSLSLERPKKLEKISDLLGEEGESSSSLSERFEALFQTKDIFVKLQFFPPMRMPTFQQFKDFVCKNLNRNRHDDDDDNDDEKNSPVENYLKQYFEQNTKNINHGNNNDKPEAKSSIPASIAASRIYAASRTKTRQLYTSPLHCASSRGRINVVKWLCSKGFDVDKNVLAPINTPLYESVRGEGGFEVTKYLIEEQKVPLDNFNEGGEKFTCCYAAAFLPGRSETLRLLLRNGANASLTTSAGATPAFGAVFGSNLQSLKTLVEFGCDITMPFGGLGLLNYTEAIGGRNDIVQYLKSIA